jgi:parallel beta-helix repeat protein
MKIQLIRFRALVVTVLVATSLLAVPAAAHAATYYVATTGSDANPGTLAAPWRSLSAAVSRLVAGDTLYIRGGVYTASTDVIDSQLAPIQSGTSWDAPITVAGFPGEAVTMRPPDGSAGIRLTNGAPHHLVFQDFAIDMSRQSDPGNPIVANRPEAIYVASGSHHIRFQRLDIGYCMNDCISFSTHNSTPTFVSNHELLDSKIHHAGQATGDNYHGGPGINTGYGIYSFTDGNLFDGNQFYSNNAYGMNVYGSHNILRNNRVYNNGLRGGTNYAINIGSSAFPANSANNLVYNNLVYNNRGGGIKVYSNAENTLVFNNTVYASGLAGIQAMYYAGGNVIRNNITYANAVNISDDGGQAALQVDHNLTANPMFTDAAAGDFTPLAGSPAIDAGTFVQPVTTDVAGGARPQGAGFDIGAYEFGVGTGLSAPKNLRVMAQ